MKKYVLFMILSALFFVGCHNTEDAFDLTSKNYIDTMDAYVEIYEVVYGKDSSGTINGLSNVFYSTFYPNNQENFDISSFDMGNVRHVKDRLKKIDETLKRSTTHHELDKECTILLKDIDALLNDLVEMEKYYKEKRFEEDDYRGAKALFKKIDSEFLTLDGKMSIYADRLSNLQLTNDELTLKHYTEKKDDWNKAVLTILIEARKLSVELNKIRFDEEYSLDIMKNAESVSSKMHAELEGLVSQKKALSKSKWTEENAKKFLSLNELFLETERSILETLTAEKKVDPTRIDQFYSDYHALVELYNKASLMK
ncbi:DUF3829 domain-containing protein [Guggenheimella bovis]